MSEAGPRYLVVLMGSLGDVVRGLSVAEQIKQQQPRASITWLVEPKCQGIVEQAANVDRVLVFDRKRPVQGIISLVKELRATQFDISLDMQRHLKSGFFSYLSGAPRRIGFHRANAKEGNWLFQTETISASHEEINKFHLYQRFTEKMGLTPSQTPRVSLKVSAGNPAAAAVRPYCFIVMSTSWPSKNWVGEGYAQVVENLISRYDVFLVGDAAEVAVAQALCEQYGKSGSVVNLCGRTSLGELVELIRGAVVGVGPDSGPGHLASALGVRYVSVFGPTSPKLVAPIGSEHLVVKATLGCSPCYRRTCPGLDRLCMRLISVPAVVDKVRVATTPRLD